MTATVDTNKALRNAAERGDEDALRSMDIIIATPEKLDFALRVPGNAPAGEVVIVRALARDSQDFEVSFTDTVYVRTGAAPP